MDEKTKQLILDHVEKYPERRVELNERLERVEQAISEAATHPQPSPRTTVMINDLSERLQGIEKTMYGDATRGEVGMNEMLKELHTKFVQANGILSFFKLILLFGGVSAMLYTFFRKF